MIIAINGSARKGWNTHALLTKALEGAKSKGAETALINLYDLSYTGCIGCLECKRKGGGSLGRCAINDGLKPVLDKIHTCDGLIIGSPIYFGEVTGMTRAFMERLFFQYFTYDVGKEPLFGRRLNTAIFYTMNVPEDMVGKVGYEDKFKANASLFDRFIGDCKTLICAETLLTNDYDKYHLSMFDPEQRHKRHSEVFPTECEKAFAIGEEMAQINVPK